MKSKKLWNPLMRERVLIALKIIAVILPVIIIFVVISGVGTKPASALTNESSATKSTLSEVSHSSTKSATKASTKSNSLATSTLENVTKETQDSRYIVTDGQEAISLIPSKDYTGGTELDDFFFDSVFVGDSITVGWSNYVYSKGNGFFGNPYFLAKVGYSLNSALSPYYDHPLYNGTRDYIYNQIAKMDNVKKVFISFGLNDALATPQTVVSNYERMINLILRYSPQVKIYVISTTYVCKGAEQGYVTSANVKAYNKLVKQFCDLNGYTFVDVASYLSTTDGYLPRTYSSDGYVHLNASAYAIWETVLRNLAQTEINAAKGLETKKSELETLPEPLTESGYINYTVSTTSATKSSTVDESDSSSKSTEETSKTTEKTSETSTNKSTENTSIDTTTASTKATEAESSKEAATEAKTEEVTTKATQIN